MKKCLTHLLFSNPVVNAALVAFALFAVPLVPGQEPSSHGSGTMCYELDRSRADPAKEQSIVTPLLHDGVGDLRFDYRVVRGTVKFVVERMFASGAPAVVLREFTESAEESPVFKTHLVSVWAFGAGKFRIRMVGSGCSPDGSVQFARLRARNNPAAEGETAWDDSDGDLAPDWWEILHGLEKL